MGTLTGTSIVNKVLVQLLDDDSQPGGGSARWNTIGVPDELQKHLYAGIRELVKEKPDAYVINAEYGPSEGVKQTLPPGGLLLIDYRNANGQAVTPVRMPDMDASFRNWRAQAPGLAQHYMHDERDPRTFYLYPPAPFYNPSSPVIGEIVYSADPGYDDATLPIPVDDIYEQALMDFVLARAYAKNTKRGDLAKSQAYDASFYARIGSKSKTQFQYAGGVTNDASAQ